VDDVAVLLDLIDLLVADVRHEVEDVTPDAVDWQPDPRANSIGLTLWHVTRWLDVLATQVFEGLPSSDEQWDVGGWVARTGYDPGGVGDLGIGALTGYTWEEVEQVPRLTGPELLEYFEQAAGALSAAVAATTTEELHQVTDALGGERTRYAWLRSVLAGALGHLGEIRAMKAMQVRRGLLRRPSAPRRRSTKLN
jgi:hypothetical protein